LISLGNDNKCWIFDTTIKSLTHGRDLGVPGISKLDDGIKIGDLIAIMSCKDELIGLGRAKMDSKGILKCDKGLAVRLEKVFMSI